MDRKQEAKDIVALQYDFTNAFKTNQRFIGKNSVIKWVKDAGNAMGTVIVTRSSYAGKTGRRGSSMYFQCERSGDYRSHRKDTKSSRKPETRKCRCPFSLRAKMVGNDEWILLVKCGTHNHPVDSYTDGQGEDGGLKVRAMDKVNELLNSDVRPSEILKIINETGELSSTTIRSIYNARARLKMGKRVGLVRKLRRVAMSEVHGCTESDGEPCASGCTQLVEEVQTAYTCADTVKQWVEPNMQGMSDEETVHTNMHAVDRAEDKAEYEAEIKHVDFAGEKNQEKQMDGGNDETLMVLLKGIKKGKNAPKRITGEVHNDDVVSVGS